MNKHSTPYRHILRGLGQVWRSSLGGNISAIESPVLKRMYVVNIYLVVATMIADHRFIDMICTEPLSRQGPRVDQNNWPQDVSCS